MEPFFVFLFFYRNWSKLVSKWLGGGKSSSDDCILETEFYYSFIDECVPNLIVLESYDGWVL